MPSKQPLTDELLAKRQAVIDRLNPNKSPYLHTFDAKTGRCTDCNRRLVDEVSTDESGVQRINMWCSVIGADEVAEFRDYEG